MKKMTLIILVFTFSLSAFSQSKISGVITYYYNEFQGNKPDIGASLIMIDSTKVSEFDYSIYEKYHYGKLYEDMYFGSLYRYEKYTSALQKLGKSKKYDEDRKNYEKGIDDAKKDMNNHKKQMEKYDYDNAENAAKVGVELYIQLLELSDDLPKKTIDASGSYSLDIEPGVYYAYIKSNNRKGVGVVDISGKIYIKKVKIVENSNKDFSYNFEP